MSRGIGVVAPIALIPITLSYFGADYYGLWMAATAVTGMAAFADLGIGYGLMTKLAPCYSNGETERARAYISSAYEILTVVAVASCVLLWLASGVISWSSVFNATGSATADDALAMALVCLTAFILNVPLSLVARVQYAYQQVAQSNLWQSAGTLCSLPLALVAIFADLSPIVVVAVIVSTAPLANALNTLWVFTRRMPELAPWRRGHHRGLRWDLLRLSGRLLVLTLVVSLASNADTLVIAHALGLPAVTAYAVPAKLFAQLGLLASLVNLPLWPAHGDALAQGQLDWVRRITRRMTLVSVGVVLLPSMVLVLSGEVLAGVLGLSIGSDRWLLAGLTAWYVLLAAISPRFMVQNASGVIGPQLVGWTLYLVCSIGAKWYAATHLGLAAVPFAGVVTYLLTALPCALIGYRRALPSARSPAT
ncbi:lipopolysaccharide biosynthesis protein [Actinopolymorpha alba]|uniref:lipopolysaccharide biosynthesis protein n=1 Tax=Actinopolymorpha alba TaxID=533267 RepID=UPI000369C74C|nr:hypothetical protein [Actinopolymorpha alba]